MSKLWICLAVFILGWGFLAGLSFARDIWLDPAAALFGMMGSIVLAVVLNKLEKQRMAALIEQAHREGWEDLHNKICKLGKFCSMHAPYGVVPFWPKNPDECEHKKTRMGADNRMHCSDCWAVVDA